VSLLGEAMEMGEREGVVRLLVDEGPLMALLLRPSSSPTWARRQARRRDRSTVSPSHRGIVVTPLA
jgi:hypothetical protein